jgi:hypothetical protein
MRKIGRAPPVTAEGELLGSLAGQLHWTAVKLISPEAMESPCSADKGTQVFLHAMRQLGLAHANPRRIQVGHRHAAASWNLPLVGRFGDQLAATGDEVNRILDAAASQSMIVKPGLDRDHHALAELA